MSRRKPCGRPIPNVGPCGYERMPGKQRCTWHWLLAQPANVQKGYAQGRLHTAITSVGADEFVNRGRVPKSEWPAGERWCAGCQSFVPLFYCSGSRCKSCSSEASHASRIEREYLITSEDYDALFAWQRGRCYICGKEPRTKRLAVDHDHQTGEVRGLLCAHNENGCNRAVIANLEASRYGGLEAAKRAVRYLEDPPYRRMRVHRGDPGFVVDPRTVDWSRVDAVREGALEDVRSSAGRAQLDALTALSPPF